MLDYKFIEWEVLSRETSKILPKTHNKLTQIEYVYSFALGLSKPDDLVL